MRRLVLCLGARALERSIQFYFGPSVFQNFKRSIDFERGILVKYALTTLKIWGENSVLASKRSKSIERSSNFLRFRALDESSEKMSFSVQAISQISSARTQH